MRSDLFNRLFLFVGNIHIDLNVALLGNASTEHEVKGNRRNDDNQHDCYGRDVTTVAVIGHFFHLHSKVGQKMSNDLAIGSR